jgi:predicted dehydrogenase
MTEVKIALHGICGHQITDQLGKMTRCRLRAVSGVEQSWLQSLKKEKPEIAGDARWNASLEEMLGSDVDLVSFCSPRRDGQAKEAMRALYAGKHVLAEKPLATRREDLAALKRAAEETGKRVWAMTTMIYDPRFVGMGKVVQGGVIGKVVQVLAQKSYPYRDYRPQDRGVDAGLIMQAGIHAVSFIRFVTGLEFEEVFAQQTGVGNPRKGELQMGANIACRMSDGSLASIVCNYCNPLTIGYWGNDQLRVFGTKGMIELVDGLNRRMLVTQDQGPRGFEDAEPNTCYPQDVIDCILDGTGTMLTQEDGFVNTGVVIAAQESADRGVAVKVER